MTILNNFCFVVVPSRSHALKSSFLQIFARSNGYLLMEILFIISSQLNTLYIAAAVVRIYHKEITHKHNR